MTLDVGRLVLVRGGNEAGAGFSAMEAVAFAAGEAWSERPRCASPTITEWMIAWNDGLDDRARQELRRYIWRLVGSKGTPAQERARRWMAADWLVRGYASAWLEAADLLPEAQWLSRLQVVRGPRDIADADVACFAAARSAREARDAAWRQAADSSSGVFDWNTAGAVWSAVADATWAAAGSAARSVVWSSTDASGPGSSDARLWDAASDAAADAAASLAWRAVHRGFLTAGARGDVDVTDPDDLWGPAQATAEQALAPTGGALQASAHIVVERMLAVTEAHQPTARLFDAARPHRHHRLPRRR
ncbi:MAG: hypothetical protein ACRD2C_24760 [Acidimicrobiales bacterium]